MEMNTRIQVEHPITEETTGLDLVKAQILAAAGEPLLPEEWDAKPAGHSIEVRINAEDPYRNFTPSPGRVEGLHFPGGPGVRVDSHLYTGYVVPPYYDSMLAKVIVRGPTRDIAIARMRRALAEFEITGLRCTTPVAQALLYDTRFLKGDYDTRFLERFMADVFPAE